MREMRGWPLPFYGFLRACEWHAPSFLKASKSSSASFSAKDLPERAFGSIKHPADRQSSSACLRNFHRHLIRGATNTARANFHGRRHISHGGIEDFHRIFPPLRSRMISSVSYITLIAVLFLPRCKHVMNHRLDCHTVIADIGKDLSLFWLCSYACDYSINE